MQDCHLLIEIKNGKTNVEMSADTWYLMDVVNAATIGDPRIAALLKIAVVTYFKYQAIPLPEMIDELSQLYIHKETRKPWSRTE
jgi:hypothetical protein